MRRQEQRDRQRATHGDNVSSPADAHEQIDEDEQGAESAESGTNSDAGSGVYGDGERNEDDSVVALPPEGTCKKWVKRIPLPRGNSFNPFNF